MRTRYPLHRVAPPVGRVSPMPWRQMRDKQECSPKGLQSESETHQICSQSKEKPSLSSRFCLSMDLNYYRNGGGAADHVATVPHER